MGMYGGGGGGSTEVEETPQQKELAEIGVERMKHYENVLKPVEDDYINKAQSMGEGEAQLASGMASADAAQSVDQIEDQSQKQAVSAGAAPGSGRYNQAVATANDAEGRARGLSQVGAREASEDRRLSALNDVVRIGLGKSAEGQKGLSDVATDAARENITDTQQDFAEDMQQRQAAASTAGGLAGLGASYMDTGGSNGAQTTPVAGSVNMRQNQRRSPRGASLGGYNHGGA